jgi:hypothetical protein
VSLLELCTSDCSQALSVVVILIIQPLLCQALIQRQSIRLTFRALSRFIPSPTTTDSPFASFPSSWSSLLGTQCCDKCLRILHCMIQVSKLSVIEAGRDTDAPEEEEVIVPVGLVVAIVRILAGVERTLNWFPVLLRAADIFQVWLSCLPI